MKLLHSLLQRETVRSYSPKKRQVNVDFMVEGIKCHKDDKHDVKGLDSQAEVPPFACSFNNSSLQGHMLALADEEGGVCLYDVRKQGPSAKLKGWVAHSNAIFDIAWVCDEPKLVTASGDQTAQLWDVQQSSRLAVFKGHSCSLKSVDFQYENLFVFATGARDGNIMVWDMRCNKRDGHYKPVNTIHNCHSTLPTTSTPQRTKKRGRRLSNAVKTQDSQQSVTSVIFQDLNTIISAGAVDGNIKVWDIRKNYSIIRTELQPYHVFPYPGSASRKHGYSSLTLDSTKSKLFANCTNDIIYMYDCVRFQTRPMATFQGHSNATFYVKSSVSPDDQYLMSGSGDGDGYIWRVDDPGAAPFHLTGHSNEVTSVAWCPRDQSKIVTCSDDNSVNIWRVNYEEKSSGDFVGWCERKPNNKPLPKEDLPDKATTPNTSPARSRSNSTAGSTASSPASLSPNPYKCNSPQQFLQNWLQSKETVSSNKNENSLGSSPRLGSKNIETAVCAKRPRDLDEADNETKRVCLDGGVEENETPFMSGTDKENMDTNIQVISEQKSVDIKSIDQTELRSELKDNGSRLKQTTSQPECRSDVAKQQGKKSNWLRDMGVRKKGVNSVPRKVNSPPQPSSPLLKEPSSPNTDLGTPLKTGKSIRDYFSPISQRKFCPR
ncbi:denticleless protein homolog B-like isoform X3 [Dendronephthya gigantea]|uniref:denticleless protein homolog B-like isoform X3 n=1 Tax=Dendronephthya gigantea TaxID=151771 RepID=UPI00106D61EB|nr:denticleless protein homolog B-like isoform X3 [Dendronephthya gigantea]